ncbi:MAG: penicillin-binding transpeptidase domain-containing protein [Gammaproteobacteria bacterium]
MNRNHVHRQYTARRIFLVLCMTLAAMLLLGRAVTLQVLDKQFLLDQGQARHLRVVSLSAHRGMIRDRHGEPLAISTPVESVWVNPQVLGSEQDRIPELARILSLEPGSVKRSLASRAGREFIYLKRHVSPDLAERAMAREVPGVYLQREYRRYYPEGEVAAHLVGFTDIDDAGQEGLELAYQTWLAGEPGAKRVVMDRQRHIVEDVESISRPRLGKDLQLSIDRRIQYLAYRELKAAMNTHEARAASAVVLDVHSGEVVAMVNQPSFNPNNRQQRRSSKMRNRAVTDVFEPGSTMKPFIVAAALESGRYRPDTPISTSPGWYRVGVNTVRDVHDYGQLDVTGVIRKSSNVGISKIALSLPPASIWELLSELGFGTPTLSGFPGEVSGLLPHYSGWNSIETATLSFGYGLSATPLQLAQAYAVLASGGIRRSISFLRAGEAAEERRVLPERIARQVRDMLESATGPDGTAPQARIPGYRVAGKTGTIRKSVAGGYAEDQYLAVFAGMVPASNPRLVMVVMVDEPSAGKFYGGQVAAPVFARVMAGALRLMAVPPDDLPLLQTSTAGAGEPA